MNKTNEIDIKRIIGELMFRAWIIVLAAVISATGAFVYAKNFIIPKYKADITLYVNNYVESVGDEIKKLSSSDISTAQSLVQTYITFIKSDTILEAVSESLGGSYSAGQIRSMISAKAVEDTEVFNVSITDVNPSEAARIANAIADKAPGLITGFIDGSSVKVIDYAKVPTSRSYPSYVKAVLFGAFGGGGLAILIIVLMALINSKISGEEDVEALGSAPLIGKIPNFSRTYGDGTGGYSYKYGYNYGYRYGRYGGYGYGRYGGYASKPNNEQKTDNAKVANGKNTKSIEPAKDTKKEGLGK